MADRSIESFVNRLAYLELKAGHKVHYRIMTPFLEPFKDIISVQKAGKHIAEFIGLTDVSFIVAIAKQKENVGGHIDLSTSSTEVFIEIDSGMMEFPNMVMATLCHEVCHKWLRINGLESPNIDDNEILTDITSVFLGFGKIMLNGCNLTIDSFSGTQTTSNTKTVGYIAREEFAIVYRLVCAMRKIPSAEYMEGLNWEASPAIYRCDESYGHLYKQDYHQPDKLQAAITDLKNKMVEVQRALADLNKHVTYAKKSFCETIDDFLSNAHKKLDKFHNNTKQNEELDPALNFLKAIQMNNNVKEMTTDISSLSKETTELLQDAKFLCIHLNHLCQQFPPPSPSLFNIVTCPKDGTKLRLPENSGDIIATCPTCQYRFAYNTNSLVLSSESEQQSWLGKLRKLI